MNNEQEIFPAEGADDTPETDIPETDIPETDAPEEDITESADICETADSENFCENCDAPQKSRIFRVLATLYDYVEVFAVSIIAVIFIFSFCVRLCRVDGSSMNNTLKDGEQIVASDLFYTPKQGDIIVFHLSNESYSKPLVKRVIATEGQAVEINFTDRKIAVDGKVYADSHAYISGGEYNIRLEFDQNHMYFENEKTYFRATVPEGHIFVLGDNRNGSSDSRSARVGFVDVDCILGKAILRLKPFSILAD